jgi:hypothetical protein
MSTKKIPSLILSETCCPIAVDSIIRNLKLQPTNIKMIEGELIRPKIRIIRVTMDHPLKSADELLKIYAPHTATNANKIVRTLIYSGTWNATFQVMKVINKARKTKLNV